jgi:hypothetical protein
MTRISTSFLLAVLSLVYVLEVCQIIIFAEVGAASQPRWQAVPAKQQVLINAI